MYDLCTRPEQPEPAPAHAGMESRQVSEAHGQRQPELRGSEERDDEQRRLLDEAVPATAHVTSTSLLGKRHHSLYANLNGFEAEGIRKVSLEYLLGLRIPFLMVGMNRFGARRHARGSPLILETRKHVDGIFSTHYSNFWFSHCRL